jgi:predicted dehydrogenase
VTNNVKLKAGVVGSGVFGRYHAQKYASHPHVEFVGVFDADPVRAAEAAAALGGRAFSALSDLLASVDAVSVTTPASTHGAVALACLQAGKHVYVEKPIATKIDEADRMIAVAAERNLVLQTGHQERLVLALTGLQDWTVKPVSMSCVRAGPFAGRALDVSVVYDLMIHDIDLAHWIAGSHSVSAKAVQRSGPGSASDEVEAEVKLANGCAVGFLASRNAPERKRTLHAVYPDGEVKIDFLTRSVQNSTPRALRPLLVDGQALHPDLADSVAGGAKRFIAAIRGEGPALVSPQEARQALQTALMILAAT